MSIYPEFKTHFDDLEKRHLALYRRLNAVKQKGRELMECLDRELAEYSHWRFDLMDRLAEAVAGFSAQQKVGHQRHIKGTEYYRIVQEAPFYWRIMNKPEGYAGDAEMMNFIYRNRYEGKTPFGMLMHKHATLCDACQAVRNRRHFLADQIKQKKGKVLSVAAGPALEMLDVLNADLSTDTFHFHAFDHDIKTIRNTRREFSDPRLRYVMGNVFDLIKGSYRVALPRKALLGVCEPRMDFKGWRKVLAPFKYGFETLEREDYDLIYSAGLYDYIMTFPGRSEKGTIALTKNLFALVKPGGSLVIGNFSPNNPRNLRFAMEYVNDWQLICRNEAEMRQFAAAIPDREIETMTVDREPLGINYFLKIKKRMNA